MRANRGVRYSLRGFITLSCLLGSWCGSLVAADDSEYKLQPLKYNNPGLEVDLGVGLWAYPLPIDYDGDGDMDLLVGCPDKPSQGTYFFENPSQSASEKLPVFRPGVRIGSGYHYMMLSQVNGEPVVLRPGKEYRRDPKSGKFNLSNPKEIEVASNLNKDARGRTRGNMWRYVDFDGDGDHDLAVGIGDWSDLGWDHAYDSVGNWRNGPLHGYVYIVTNEGSDANPNFSEVPFRLQAGGGEVDVYGWPSPNFADFDGDGDLDLLCGEFLDGFTYFQNTGSRNEPHYAAGQKLKDRHGAALVMQLQMITPTAVDWDADGDLDLIVGDEDGRVAFVENTGQLRDGVPQFESPAYFRQQADTLKFGALATPFAYDWDDDGDEDILCGNTAGSIGFFENLGKGEHDLPKWNGPVLLHVKAQNGTHPFRVMAGPNGSIQGPCEAKWGYTTLSVADWDGDGDGDIVYNSILGRVGLLLNENGVLREQQIDSRRSEMPPSWCWWQTPSSETLTQWRTTPLAFDFDGDTKLDLIMLDQQGFLTLRSAGGRAQRVFVDESGNALQLNAGTCGSSGRVKLALVDWDGDSRMDLLVNSENAMWYRNCESRDGKVVLKKIGNLASRNVAGHTSSPAVCDFDRNGKPDLLVGSENGRIYHITHQDCISFSKEETAVVQRDAPRPPRFAGLVYEEFVFDKAPFKECHTSTICQTSRGLVASWLGGSQEGQEDVGIWTSYHDGKKWNYPVQVADGVQHDDLRYPCWNPVLYQPPGDAPTLLFFKVGSNSSAWWGELMISYDRGRTFRDRRRLPEGISGPDRGSPKLLANAKTLLCGASAERDGWRVHFESVQLVDGIPSGVWLRTGPINDTSEFDAMQPSLLNHPDGRLQVLCCTKEGVIASSFFAGVDQTWSPLKTANLPTPNSEIAAVTLADGRHLLVFNHVGVKEGALGSCGSLSLAISDDGLRWHKTAVLEQQRGVEPSYPAIIQSADGRVHITYTWNRQRIKHLVLDPIKLIAGDLLGRGQRDVTIE